MPLGLGNRFRTSSISAFAAFFVLGIGLTLTGCQKEADGSGDASDSNNTTTTEGAPADSASVAAADSTESESGSWKDKLFGGGDEPEEKPEPAVPVETARASRRDIPSYLSSTATLEPEKQADLVAQTDGTVRRIRVEEGDWVKEGQTLAELDGAAAAVDLEEATAQARGLKLELDRVEGLASQNLSSEKALHDAKSAYEQAEARRKGAELRNRYTRIRAPFAGIISNRMVDIGQHVATGTALFTLVDQTPLLAKIYLPENEVRELAPGQELLVEVDGEADKIAGSVLRIAPTVDTRTGTIKVTCQVEDSETELLRPGSFVRVLVQTGLHEQVLTIPKRALVPEGAENYVYRTVADSVLKVHVATGFSDKEFVEIVEGLEMGDRIVTVGHGGLENGTKIDDLSSSGTSDEAKPEDPSTDPTEVPSADTAARTQ